MKRVLYQISITLLCGLLLASCVNLPSPTLDPVNSIPTRQVETTSPIITALPATDKTSLPTAHLTSQPSQFPATPTISTPAPGGEDQVPARYTLDASLDYFAHTVSVTETVSYTNTTSSSLSDLVLVVEPNRWSGCYNLLSITWLNGEPVEGYELNKAQLHIPLPSVLANGQNLGLRLVYQLDLPEIPAPSEEIRPVPFGFSARQINLVDWYAYVPPYLAGTGWLAHPRWGFGEHQVYDVGDYDVRLSLAEPVEDLVIAASAPATQAGGQYSYHLKMARSFALSASNEYLVQSTSVGDVTVYSYSFPFDKAAGEQALHDTAKAVELYSSLLVPYPHATLSVVEADFLDGMEYDGLFFLSRGFYNLYDGTPQGYLTFIAAHETAHQWWYGVVGNDQALEPWLDEAMCTYMERIYYERVYPDYQTTSGESLLDWWWYYRVNYYQPTGWIDAALYDFQLFRPYRDAIYLNGANFLEDLRSLIGDQAFFEFLKDYANSEKHKVATANDFFSILKHHTAQNLDDLIGAYFKTSH